MLKANLLTHDGYAGNDLKRLEGTLSLIEATLNSERFKAAVLNFKDFHFKKYKCFLNIKTGEEQLEVFTNQAIFNTILDGHASKDGISSMDLCLALKSGEKSSTVGYTDKNNLITTYKNKFDEMSDQELAAHYTHEWVHTLGFEHSKSNRCDELRDCYSVPYVIGNFVEIILTGKNYYNCNYATKI